MTHLLISALLPLVVATTCPEGSDSCSSSSQALLQSSMSHQIGMDDASEGGLKPLLLMFQQGGARWGRGDGQGLKDSSKSEHLLGQLETRVGAAALDNKRLSPLEGSLMKALNETIENTTLPALKKGHEDDQKEMNRTVQALANCNDNFATDSKKAASARQMVDALKDTHRQCRGNQSKLKGVRAENMKDLKSFVDNLQQPQKPASLAPTAADSYFAAGMKWFKENQATYAQKKVAYTAAKEEHDNKTDICNAAQTRYESGYCQWVGQGSAASKSYTRCWQQGSGNDWKQIRATVLDSAEQRKHEYVAAKKIQCFLSSLLILFSKAGAVTKQNISACKVLMPDTSIFDLVNTDAPPKKSVASLGNLTSMPGDGVWQHSEYAAISGVKNITPCAKALDDNDTLIWKDGNMSHYCNADEKVLMHRCLACEAGKSSVREDALGPDTNCSAIICDADEHVVSNSCTSCSPGKVRLEGDDASGADTACLPPICQSADGNCTKVPTKGPHPVTICQNGMYLMTTKHSQYSSLQFMCTGKGSGNWGLEGSSRAPGHDCKASDPYSASINHLYNPDRGSGHHSRVCYRGYFGCVTCATTTTTTQPPPICQSADGNCTKVPTKGPHPVTICQNGMYLMTTKHSQYSSLQFMCTGKGSGNWGLEGSSRAPGHDCKASDPYSASINHLYNPDRGSGHHSRVCYRGYFGCVACVKEAR